MDFQLTENQKMLVQGLRDVLTKEYPKDYFRKLEENEEWPWDVLKKLGALGYIALGVPEKDGGMGGTTLDETLCVEEAARIMGCSSQAYFTSLTFGAKAIALHGTEAQKKEYLPGLMAGTDWTGLSLTEADGGTDILRMKTRARPDGKGNWIINGEKMFTTGAHVAKAVIAVVRTSGFEEKKTKGITMFIVPTNSKGLEIVKIPLVHRTSEQACRVTYDNVVVPEENIFAGLDVGLFSLFDILNEERICAGAMAVGQAQGAMEEALEYAKVRNAFGGPIGRFQAIQHVIAESWVRIQAARYFLYRAAWLDDQAHDKESGMAATAAKLFASETAVYVLGECADVLGGYQATREFNIPYFFHSSRFTFAPITNHMIRNFIGEQLGLPKSY